MAELEVKLCAECFWCVEHNATPIDWRCRYLIKDLPDMLRGNSVDSGGTHCVTMRVMEKCCGREAKWFKQRHNPLKCKRCAHRTDQSHRDACGECEAAGGNPKLKADDE